MNSPSTALLSKPGKINGLQMNRLSMQKYTTNILLKYIDFFFKSRSSDFVKCDKLQVTNVVIFRF